MLHRFLILPMMALQLLLFSPTIVNAYELDFFYYYPRDGRSTRSFSFGPEAELPCYTRDVRVNWLKFSNENTTYVLKGYLPSNCTGDPLFILTEPTPYYQTPLQWESFSIRIKANK